MVVDKGQMSVAELAKITGVSEVTIRQDLNTLEKQSYLRRAHGFAVSLESDDVETRMMTNYTLKRRLAEFAASLVSPGNPFLLKMAAAMRYWPGRWRNKRCHDHHREQLYRAPAQRDPLRSHSPWWNLSEKSESMVGPLTRQFIHQVHFSKAFIGIDGWQADTGFTGRDMMRSDVVNAVLEKGSEAIVLTDSSKFGCVHPYPLGPLSRFHRVITDSKISASDQMQLEHAGLLVNVIGSSV